MSGRKAIIKSTVVKFFCALIFVIVGMFLFSAVNIENSAPPVSDGFQAVEAQVNNVESEEKEYIERKINGSGNRRVTKIIYTADVTFEYGGQQHSASVTGVPFLKEGDTTRILYNPATGQVKGDFSGLETVFSLVAYIPAVFCLAIGAIIFLAAVISAVRRFSLFNEKNKVYGEIVEVEENFNIVINHKHPKVAICVFDEPGTGKRLRARSVNSMLDLFSMVGMSVPVYYNRSNPAKSFVDLENAYNGTLHEENGPAVHDFRNL